MWIIDTKKKKGRRKENNNNDKSVITFCRVALDEEQTNITFASLETVRDRFTQRHMPVSPWQLLLSSRPKYAPRPPKQSRIPLCWPKQPVCETHYFFPQNHMLIDSLLPNSPCTGCLRRQALKCEPK